MNISCALKCKDNVYTVLVSYSLISESVILLQVPLGVLPKQEILYDDMIDILEHYKQYLPSKTVQLNEKNSWK